MFSCSTIGSRSYLTLDLHTECWGNQHLSRFVPIGVAGLLVYGIALPLVLIFSMRSRLLSYQKDLVISFLYGIFTAGYPDGRYFMYLLIFLRNILLAILSGLFMKDVPSYLVGPF